MPTCTVEKYQEINENILAGIEHENALIDKYLNLSDRPRIKTMVRVTEVSEPFEAEIVDADDYFLWRKSCQ